MSAVEGIDVLMLPTVPLAEPVGQPHSEPILAYRQGMAFKDPRTFLWSNICSLMGAAPQDKQPSIDAVKARVGVGRGTAQRIKAQSAATQLDNLTIIAGKLGVPVWRLLLPDEEAASAQPVSPQALEVARLFDQIDPAGQRIIMAMAHALQRPDAPPSDAPPWIEPKRSPGLDQQRPGGSAQARPFAKREP